MNKTLLIALIGIGAYMLFRKKDTPANLINTKTGFRSGTMEILGNYKKVKK